MGVIIRHYQAGDLPALHRIDRLCFSEGMAYTLEELRSCVNEQRSITLIAEDAGTVVGFIVAQIEKRRFGHIITIDVLPEYRQKGVGTRLLALAENWLVDSGAVIIYLETATQNRKAITFYKKHGYAIMEKIERYYDDGDDAYQMVKNHRSTC